VKYIVDIDNTILINKDSDYENSIPMLDRIEKLNKLFDEGHEIIYWTSRGAVSGKVWNTFTINQLRKYGCKFTQCWSVIKPHYDVWIDDKAINAQDFFK
jgi:hypothetical protein